MPYAAAGYSNKIDQK